MHLVRWQRPLSSIALSSLILAASVLPASGGEKANISVPSKPSPAADPAAAPPPRSPFEPMDRESSLGGVVDAPAAPGVSSPAIPDVRRQKEIIEQLDRRKNWLLDDPSGPGKNSGKSINLESSSEIDYSTNPRRPQTALDRRLRNGSRNVATEAAERDAQQRAYFAQQEEIALEDSGFDSLGRSRIGSGLSPIGSPLLPTTGKGLESSATALAPSEGVRTSLSSNGYRTDSVDSSTRERMERYQRASGAGDPFGGGTSLATSADNAQTRSLRSDVMEQLFRAGSDSRSAALTDKSLVDNSGSDRATGTSMVARSTVASSSSSGVPVNPYAAPVKAPEPYVSPAAKMMRATPQEIPRFRP